MAAVRASFKPEFLNRLDDVIIFDALSTAELARIVDIQVARLGQRLAARRLTLTVTPAAKDWLALTGFDPVYGARPLRRLVQSAIGDKLAKGAAVRRDHRRRRGDRRPGLDADELTVKHGDASRVSLTSPARRPASRPSRPCGGSRPACGRSRPRRGRGPPGSGSGGGAAAAAPPHRRAGCTARRRPSPSHGARRRSPCSVNSSASRSQVRGVTASRSAVSAGEQQLRLGLAVKVEQRPGQVNPGLGERSAAVLDRGGELVRRALRVVGHHPLLARPHMGLGAQARIGLLRELAHANGGPHMVARTRRLELDLVEVFDAFATLPTVPQRPFSIPTDCVRIRCSS